VGAKPQNKLLMIIYCTQRPDLVVSQQVVVSDSAAAAVIKRGLLPIDISVMLFPFKTE
jgi:hypothetical protein